MGEKSFDFEKSFLFKLSVVIFTIALLYLLVLVLVFPMQNLLIGKIVQRQKILFLMK